MIGLKQFARLYYFLHLYEEAKKYVSEALDLEPDDYEAHVIWGAVLVEQHDYHKALDVFHRVQNRQQDMESLGLIGYTYARSADKANALDIVGKLKSGDTTCNALKIGRILSALGDERAFDWLEIALKNREFDLLALNVDPRTKSLCTIFGFRNLSTKLSRCRIEKQLGERRFAIDLVIRTRPLGL